jgi:septal ring factor EnvC (AmiA/AmiB activator)
LLAKDDLERAVQQYIERLAEFEARLQEKEREKQELLETCRSLSEDNSTLEGKVMSMTESSNESQMAVRYGLCFVLFTVQPFCSLHSQCCSVVVSRTQEMQINELQQQLELVANLGSTKHGENTRLENRVANMSRAIAKLEEELRRTEQEKDKMRAEVQAARQLSFRFVPVAGLLRLQVSDVASLCRVQQHFE